MLLTIYYAVIQKTISPRKSWEGVSEGTNLVKIMNNRDCWNVYPFSCFVFVVNKTLAETVVKRR